jgi:Cu+-exporting ATPase
LIAVTASVEKGSEHLMGKAIVRYAEEKRLMLHECRDAKVTPGQGIAGEVSIGGVWKNVRVGNRAFVGDPASHGVAGTDERATSYVAWDGQIQGSIRLSDELRPDAISTSKGLLEQEIHVVILSGDTQANVEIAGREIGTNEAYGGLLPAQKVERIHALRSEGRTVLMAGDGINDAPALAAADVGVALGSATDLTKENADVTIIGTKLSRILFLLRLGEKTYAIIRWNLFWAFIYNIAGILLAAFGFLDPILAALAMIVSSLLIIVNSRRLNAVSREQ